jgi:hypothetical protein
MRFLITGILSFLKLRLGSFRGWFILLLLPLLILGARSVLPAQEVSSPVQVGVALPESGGEEFWALLQQRNGTVLTFLLADETVIDQNIAAGNWDCGLILKEDFAQRLEEMDLDRIISVRIGPGSTVYPLVQETAAACMAQLISPGIAREYLLESGIFPETVSQAQLLETLKNQMGEPDRVLVSMSTAKGEPLDPFRLADSGITTMLYWCISGVLLVWMLLCATDLGQWISSPGSKRLVPIRCASCLMWAKIGADGILAWIAGCTAMLLLNAGISGCAAVTMYLMFWMSAAVLLAHFPSVSSILPVCVPFLVVISLLLSSALADISLISPHLAGVAGLLPVSAFLHLSGGDLMRGLLLPVYGLVCIGLSFAADKLKQ